MKREALATTVATAVEAMTLTSALDYRSSLRRHVEDVLDTTWVVDHVDPSGATSIMLNAPDDAGRRNAARMSSP